MMNNMLTDEEEYEVTTTLAKCSIIVYINCPNYPLDNTMDVKDYYPKDYERVNIQEMNDLASDFFNGIRTRETYNDTMALYSYLKEKYNYDDSSDLQRIYTED